MAAGGGDLDSLVRTSTAGGAERGVDTAHSRRVPSAESKVVAIPIVTCRWGNIHRPVVVVVGSAKPHLMFGRRGHLNRQSKDQQRAENSRRDFLHARLRLVGHSVEATRLAALIAALMQQIEPDRRGPPWLDMRSGGCGPCYISRSLDGRSHVFANGSTQPDRAAAYPDFFQHRPASDCPGTAGTKSSATGN
jgi:hypothetical protein